ncbi:stress response protein NST1-like isoform X2 [Lycium ferocissimum]|uniref:stress response protein NST1-like isoform X2 n=1 Tax=Lycium ferocissimum TaxID=112874 RepID=UPI0028149B6B|nr:stress response protein NST1-like isoform X2 [Lycium ferocissimum]
MCILCQIQRWSRGVATMLPWLVIPLVGLWALSQLLPPAFRFEITSPRLGCVMVLLFTLVWYEVLMPWLTAWHVRRIARARERKRLVAVEMQKLRKIATRKCRNCSTPYRDQNPGGGKFMCCYCGHVSKRPVLDLPVQPGLGFLNSGILKDLIGKGGKILNGNVWPENRWMCGQDSFENGNWVRGSSVGNSNSWSKNGTGFFDREHCLAEKSYSRVFNLACKALTNFFSTIIWICRTFFRISSSRDDDASMDAEQRAMLDKRRENGGNCQESRWEKSRRKAEEKKQARLEKELLEEEERKQREEVARLVEERRKLREEHTEAEKEQRKVSPSDKVRKSKREAEKRRQEKRKERDRCSSKSNSDTEELDKRAGKGSEQTKCDVSDRRQQHKNRQETVKIHNAEVIHGSKGASTSNHNHGNAMRGSFLSSSRAFTGGDHFGKSNNTSTVPREHKSKTGMDHIQTHASRRELSQPDRVSGKLNTNGDDKSINHPVLIESQPCTAPKKSWQQLFTHSTAVYRPTSNVISRPSVKPQAEVQTPPYPRQPPSTQSFDNPISFGLPSPFPLSNFALGSTSNITTLPLSSEPLFPLVGDGAGLDKPCPVKHGNTSSEVTRPSPIECPISRLCVPEERHAESFLFPRTPKSQDVRTVPPMNVSSNADDTGTWQMWNSFPLGQDGLSLIGTPANWLSNPEPNRSNMEEIIPSAPPKTMASLFKNDDPVLSVSHSPQTVYAGNCQNSAALGANLPSSAENGFQKALFGTYSRGESQFSLNPENAAHSDYNSPNAPVTSYPFELSPPDSWAKKGWTQQGSGEGVGNPQVTRASIGGLYHTPDVQSLWS